MKKFLLTVICVIADLSLLAMVSCTKKTTVSPTGATATTIPSATPTLTPVPLETSDFEVGSLDGWTWTGFYNMSQTGSTTDSDDAPAPHVDPYKNLGMAELPFGLGAAGAYVTNTAEKLESTPYPSFQGRSIIAHVWIPAALTDTADVYELAIFFTGGTTPNTYSQATRLNTCTGFAWNTFTYTLPTSGQAFADESSVQAYGIELLQNGGEALSNPNGEILFLDDVVVQ
jgi:hypothetical protein